MLNFVRTGMVHLNTNVRSVQTPAHFDENSLCITSDPNRDDDPEYIVRLVGQVIRVSLETVEIVNALPGEFEPAAK